MEMQTVNQGFVVCPSCAENTMELYEHLKDKEGGNKECPLCKKSFHRCVSSTVSYENRDECEYCCAGKGRGPVVFKRKRDEEQPSAPRRITLRSIDDAFIYLDPATIRRVEQGTIDKFRSDLNGDLDAMSSRFQYNEMTRIQAEDGLHFVEEDPLTVNKLIELALRGATPVPFITVNDCVFREDEILFNSIVEKEVTVTKKMRSIGLKNGRVFNFSDRLPVSYGVGFEK